MVQLTTPGRPTAKSAISHLRQLCRSVVRHSRPGCMSRQRSDHVHSHQQGRRWLLRFAATTAQRDTAAAAASLALCTRTPEFQPLRPGISQSFSDFRIVSDIHSRQRLRSASSIPTLSFLPHADLHLATAHFQSHCRSTGMERVTAQCYLRAVSLSISATSENFPVPAITASLRLVTASSS